MPKDAIIHWITQYGYGGIFSLLMLGIAGLPVPDETLLTLVGFLIFKGDLQVVPAIGAAFSGSVCGITLSYVLGRTGGVYLVKRYGHLLHITPQGLKRVLGWFERVGRWALVCGYFIPGVRHLTAYVAGMSRLPYPIFAVFAYVGAGMWSFTFIAAGYLLAEEWERLVGMIHTGTLIAFGLAITSFLLYCMGRWMKQRRSGIPPG